MMPETMTLEQYKNLRSGRRKRNKFGARKTMYKGVRYDSKMEAAYAAELDKQLKYGNILSVERQPHFEILKSGLTEWGMSYNNVIYTPDFLVYYANGNRAAIEVKGKETRDYLVRKKLFYAAYPQIPLRVVTYTKKTKWIELDDLKKLNRKRRKAVGK
jgi:hypothetical protein